MKTIRASLCLGIALLLWSGGPSQGAPAAPEKAVSLQALEKMPVKEITVFKDGHAFVLHEGQMPTDEAGNIQLDYLPRPVLGTFWPFCADKKVKLESVASTRRRVRVERTALEIREFIEANVGAAVTITEKGWQDRPGESYSATILEIPVRGSEEIAATSAPYAEPRLPQKGGIVLLQTKQGVRAVALERILDITFANKPKPTVENEEFRNLLTLRLTWPGGKISKQAAVGLMYVERGVRWIPSYKVEIDGKGHAVVQMQATIINELVDLEDVSAHLVIGVPQFRFKDMTDPISLQETVTQVASRTSRDSRMNTMLSNAMMSQAAFVPSRFEGPRESDTSVDLGPEIASSGKSEDLFVFDVPHLTLKKGQRMVLSVGEFRVSYEDVHKLQVPFLPPPTVRASFNTDQQRELAQNLAAPKVRHVIRLKNATSQPFTTAPALILREGRVLAQGLMTYTAAGSNCDLNVTTAVDVAVKVGEEETKRTPNAVRMNGDDYSRVDLKGTIGLINYKKTPVEIEVVREVLGRLDTASGNGVMVKTGMYGDLPYSYDEEFPFWWRWWSWPWWWTSLNGTGRVTWNVTLKPGEKTELECAWHYFWR